jgi:hypothetical protein
MAKAYYHTFSSGEGSLVLEDLHASFMDRCSHNEDDPNPHQTAFRDGQRSVLLLIKALMAQGMLQPESRVSSGDADLNTPTFTG